MNVGITQRVESFYGGKEIRDCLDQQWFTFLETCNLEGVPIPNSLSEPVSFFKNQNLKGIILSGGNNISKIFPTFNGTLNRINNDLADSSRNRDITEGLLLKFALEEKIPTIGICRGMQAINIFFGGGLRTISGHVNNLHMVHLKENKFLNFTRTVNSEFKVNSFHNYGIDLKNIGTNLVPMFVDEKGLVEGITHDSGLFCGVMWHPERERPFEDLDRLIFTNFFET